MFITVPSIAFSRGGGLDIPKHTGPSMVEVETVRCLCE